MSGFPLNDTITYWVQTLVAGKPKFVGVGIKANAAVASRREEIVTEQGKDAKISKLAIYFDSAIDDIKIDDMIVDADKEGDAVEPDTTGAKRILAISRVPSGTTLKRALI